MPLCALCVSVVNFPELANQRTAAALKAKGYHYKFVEGMGVGHCDGKVQSATLADALIWVWRGYEPTTN